MTSWGTMRPMAPLEYTLTTTRPPGSSTNPVDCRNSGSSLTNAPVASAIAEASTPYPTGNRKPCLAMGPGQFLFTVNSGSVEISRYQIAPDGTLTLLGSTPVAATGGVGAVDARLSPDGRFLYVDESRIGKVGAFAVNGGNLTELGTSPFALPAGATPAGIVVS